MFNSLSKDWFKRHFNDKKTVAIIGNSPNVLQSMAGEYIDSFDIVCRMNNYQIKSFEKYIGSKTDIYVTSLSNHPEKTLEELQKNAIESVFVTRPISKKYSYNVALGEMLKNFSIVKSFDPVFVSESDFDELYGKLGLENNADGINPTSGLTFIYVLLNNICFESIYITGFDFFDSKNGLKMHFYKEDTFDHEGIVELTEKYHPRLNEMRTFRDLVKNNQNVILDQCIQKYVNELGD